MQQEIVYELATDRANAPPVFFFFFFFLHVWLRLKVIYCLWHIKYVQQWGRATVACVRDLYVYRIGTNSSHQRKLRTWASHVWRILNQFFTRQIISTWEIWAQISPPIYRNWPFVNFNFGKCDVLVSFLLMGEKFSMCDIYGSTDHWDSAVRAVGSIYRLTFSIPAYDLLRAFMVLPMVPMVYQYRSRFYQWYHW